MDGPQDLGGMHGFGPVGAEPEAEEPVFHAEWESRVLGLSIAATAIGGWSADTSRHARERQHPVDYLRNSYYENWLAGLETLLLERGLITAEEIKSGRAAAPAEPAQRERVLKPEVVAGVLAKGRPVDREIDAAPEYDLGDTVRVVVMHPTGHTRAPRYARGRTGVIDAHYGAHVYPDLSARGEEIGVHLYSVRFEAKELWGPDAIGRGAVYVDLWERYLERVRA